MTTHTLALPPRDVVRARVSARLEPDQRGCLVFSGEKVKDGYGRMMICGRRWTTHRLVAYAWHGMDLLDSSAHALHHCDNPPCCNPQHIYVGTPADNARDMQSRGRSGAWKLLRYDTVQHCRVCAAAYEPAPSHRGRSQVCSKECLAALRSAFRRGQGLKIDAATASAIFADVQSMTGVAVARKYGVSTALVSMIRSGKVWAQ